MIALGAPAPAVAAASAPPTEAVPTDQALQGLDAFITEAMRRAPVAAPPRLL